MGPTIRCGVEARVAGGGKYVGGGGAGGEGFVGWIRKNFCGWKAQALEGRKKLRFVVVGVYNGFSIVTTGRRVPTRHVSLD